MLLTRAEFEGLFLPHDSPIFLAGLLLRYCRFSLLGVLTELEDFGCVFGLRSPYRPRVTTQHDDGTFSHFFFRSLHDCRKIPTYFTRLSQKARGYMMYSSSSCTRGHSTDRGEPHVSLSRLNHRLPRCETHPEVVQGAAEFQHQIADALLPQADSPFAAPALTPRRMASWSA